MTPSSFSSVQPPVSDSEWICNSFFRTHPMNSRGCSYRAVPPCRFVGNSAVTPRHSETATTFARRVMGISRTRVEVGGKMST
jgi:hypothetical protein